MSVLCQDYSGISINQNASATGWFNIPNQTTIYQTFILPVDYIRGSLAAEQRIPDMSGIQVLVDIPEGLEEYAEISYTLGYQLPQGQIQSAPFSPTTVSTGSATGTYMSGNVWFDIIFTDSVAVSQEWLEYLWVLELTFTNSDTDSEINAFNTVAYVTPQTVQGGAYTVFAAQTQTPLESPSATINFRLLSLSADEGTDFLGNQFRSVVVTAPSNNLSTTDNEIPLGGFTDYWMSPALPSPNAVASLYFDMRQTTGEAVYEAVNLAGNPSFEHDYVGYAPLYWETLVGGATLGSFQVATEHATEGNNSLLFEVTEITNNNTVSIVSPAFQIGSASYGSYVGRADYFIESGLTNGNVTLQYDFFNVDDIVFSTGNGNNYIANGNFQHDTLNTTPYGWTQTGFSTFEVNNALDIGYPTLNMIVEPTVPGDAIATSNTFPVLAGAYYPVTAYVNIMGAIGDEYEPSAWNVTLGVTWYNNSDSIISSISLSDAVHIGAATLNGYVQAPSNAVTGVVTMTVNTIALNTDGTNSLEVCIDQICFGTYEYVDGDTEGYQWIGTAGQSYSYQQPEATPVTQIVNAPANTDSMRIAINFNSTGETSTIETYIDAICVEYTQQSPSVPTYFDGDFPNATWVGQYDNSFSAQVVEASLIDGPVVIDALVFETLTPNINYNLYYSSDDSTDVDPMTEEAWEQKLWTRVPQVFDTSTNQITVLPSPIGAEYIKIELINPQAQSYTPSDIQLQTPYNTFPSWVQNYFQANAAYEAYIADQVVVQQSALIALYLPQTDDLTQSPNLPPAIPTSATVSVSSGNIDNTTLGQINLQTTPYQDNLGSTASPDTTIGQLALSNANTFTNGPQQTTEGKAVVYPNITTVSSLQRDSVLAEQLSPNMYFFYTCRHTYMENYATFDNGKAYFFGVNSVTFLRSNHVVASNSTIYTETGGDSANSILNDFTVADGTWTL